MANLNLSQFGEKLFVADADHTFIWDTAASISKRVSRNSWLSGTTANCRLGLADAATPVAQTLSVQSVVAGTTNTAGAAFTIDGSQGTGTGAGGALIFRTAAAGSSGTAQNALATAMLITADKRVVPTGLTIDGSGLFEIFNDLATAQGRTFPARSASIGRVGICYRADAQIAWSPGNGSTVDGGNMGTADTILLRDGAANTLALRNGAAAQTFNVYGTYTSGSVYERMFMRYNGTDLAFQVGAETLGATARPLQLWTGGASRLHITTAGNVGIGTTNPTTNLVVQGTVSAGMYCRSATNTFDGSYIGSNGQYESVFDANTNSNASGQRLIRFGNVNGGNFTIRAMDDTGSTTLRTPVSISNLAPTGSLQILSSGNVGIGTTAPGSTLTVAGTFHFGSNNGALIGGTSYGGHLGSTQYFGLRSTSAVSTTIYLQNNSSGDKNAVIRILGSGSGADHGALDINTIESSPILFTTGLSNERMRITSAGNVGIGTTSPTSKLHVAGELGSNVVTYDSGAALRLTNTTVNSSWLLTSGIIGVANGHFSIRRDSVALPALVIAGITDNVGIGITTPTAKLHVAGTIKPEQATMVDKAAGFTLAAVDAGTVINSTSATAITINLPAADTAAGYNVMIIQSGAGAVTIAANGNTLNSFGNALITAGQHAACSIVRTAASTYNLSGNLV